jgi:hypothetical protein
MRALRMPFLLGDGRPLVEIGKRRGLTRLMLVHSIIAEMLIVSIIGAA